MPYVGKTPVVGNFVKLDAITTSATATYNLLNGGVAYFPQTANNCIVSLNGVIQSPTSAYTISGSTIVFSDALTASDSIDFILVLGDVLSIGTPSDSTVGFAKVTSNLITGATAETSIDGADSVLIYDDSASALRKMTRTNFVSGLGGLTNAQMFKINDTSCAGGTQTLLNNIDDYSAQTGYGALGSLLVTESSGIFSFSQTGYYLISSNICFYATGATSSRYIESYIYVSTNGGSSYSVANSGITSLANVTGNNDFANLNMQHILDVTNASNFKFKIEINPENTVNTEASNSHSNITVIKLAET
jgi:hypothetical protein